MSDDYLNAPRGLEEERISELLGLLKEDVRASADLRDSVMREIAKERPSVAVRVVEWLLRPRLVPINPAIGGLAVAALAVLLLVRPATAPVTLQSDRAVEEARVLTRFVLVAPGASSVNVTGDFMSWSGEGFALEDLRGSGIWTGDIALPPGVHQYTFVVNGTEWVPDPGAVLQVDDGFGQVNSILVVQEAGQV